MGKKGHTKIKNQNLIKIISEDRSIENALDYLATKRTGGAVNFRGINFQILYASFLIMKHLGDNEKDASITLEGLEDIDVNLASGKQYIQVKTSQNSIDASILWNLKVLQHFWEVNEIQPGSTFQLAHNTNLSHGKTEGVGSLNISGEVVRFWRDKFITIGISDTEDKFKGFLQRIAIIKTSEPSLINEIKKILFKKFAINIGTELQYLKALFFNVFEWSKLRKTISFSDVLTLVHSVQDSFSRFPTNLAIQNDWITPVSYEAKSEIVSYGYYDGKAARPEDIASNLPVHRPMWEGQIMQSLQEFDAIVIKSSSGQGKSTLGWQVGYLMMEKSFIVYQANFCTSFNEATAIADFIKTRLAIGQSPIVVLDGLNKNVSSWAELAQLLRNEPVKFIITTRQEDWIKYGGDDSKISLKVIDISLSIQEAADIYKELEKVKKLHPSIKSWQPVWERVKEKGLLIEYIFLLTQGQMIEERLNYQIRDLSKEQDGRAKLELLRLIALADVLNIRIKTANLTFYVRDNIQTMDRNEVYKQLEKEYYLKFETKYVEGLHPVRSQHLVEILHSHIGIQDSLLTLLEIIDEEYIYDYFISAPMMLDDPEFYKNAASIVAKKTLPQMVYAIDGLMHFEPYKYWKENQAVFDQAFVNGGFELFVYDALPFSKLNTLQSLSEFMNGDFGSNLRYLLAQLTKLTKYSIENSILFQFIKNLQDALLRTKYESFEGVAFLYKWFKLVGVPFPTIIEINEEELLSGLKNKTISESSELFHFYNLSEPDKYKLFISKHRNLVTAWIKRKTNTLSIYEQGEDIHIEYLLDQDADKGNELSIYRINIVHAFFPFHKHYCTSGIVLPFPNAEHHKAVLLNAHKRIPPENLFDDFDVHINQIWSKTILSQYDAASFYEWQKEHLRLREKSLELAKKITWLFEAHLERSQSKVKTLANTVSTLANDFFVLDKALKKYPSNSRKYFDKTAFATEENAYSKWLSSFRNFVNQMSGLISPKTDHDRHLPVINLESAAFHLRGMQDAYEKIIEGSHEYFPTAELSMAESIWYPRLLDTVRYYVHQAKKGFKTEIIVASKSVAIWNNAEQQAKLEDFHSIITSFGNESPFIFYLPKEIIKEEHLSYAVIGVWGADVRTEQDLWDLSVGLKDLSNSGIDFFTLVFVDDEKKVTEAIQFNRDYFNRIKKAIDHNEFDESESSCPIQIFPNEALISVLDGISLRSIPSNCTFEAYFKMLMSAWKLSEYRKRLCSSELAEKDWLKVLEEEEQKTIRQNYPLVYSNQSLALKPDQDRMEQFLNKKFELDKDEIVQHLINASLRVDAFD